MDYQFKYGSSAELETQLIIERELYPNIGLRNSNILLEEIQKMLNSLINKLENKSLIN